MKQKSAFLIKIYRQTLHSRATSCGPQSPSKPIILGNFRQQNLLLKIIPKQFVATWQNRCPQATCSWLQLHWKKLEHLHKRQSHFTMQMKRTIVYDIFKISINLFDLKIKIGHPDQNFKKICLYYVHRIYLVILSFRRTQ